MVNILTPHMIKRLRGFLNITLGQDNRALHEDLEVQSLKKQVLATS